MHVLEAHTSVHQTRQTSKVQIDILEKWYNNVVLPMVRDQRIMQCKVLTDIII